MYQRSRAELIAGLRDQLAALESSCNGYDAGDLWEGPRIATAVYNIVNDGKSKSQSILTQLGIRVEMQFVSHSEPKDPDNLIAWAPLVMTHFENVGPETGTVSYIAQLDKGSKPPAMVKFAQWWGEPVFENNRGQLSRMNLTFALRSKDGGSHFDGEIPISTYLELKTDGIGFVRTDNGIAFNLPGQNSPDLEGLPKIPNAHLATMRHIGFEVQESIRLYLQGCGYDSIEQLQ